MENDAFKHSHQKVTLINKSNIKPEIINHKSGPQFPVEETPYLQILNFKINKTVTSHVCAAYITLICSLDLFLRNRWQEAIKASRHELPRLQRKQEIHNSVQVKRVVETARLQLFYKYVGHLKSSAHCMFTL
jgi:hypothetical protein